MGKTMKDLADLYKKRQEEEEKKKTQASVKSTMTANDIWANRPNQGLTISQPTVGSSAPYANVAEEKEDSNKSGGYTMQDFANLYKKRQASQVGAGLGDRINSYLDSFNSYTQDYSSRFSGRTGTYEDGYVSDASKWLSSFTTKGNNLQTIAESIISDLDTYSDFYDAEYVKKAKEAIFNSLSYKKQMSEGATNDANYWSQFKDENAYKDWIKTQKQNEEYASVNLDYEWKTYNIDEEKLDEVKGLEDTRLHLTSELNGILKTRNKTGNPKWGQEKEAEIRNEISKIDAYINIRTNGMGSEGLEAYLSERHAYLTQAERYQNGVKLASAVNASDFEELAQKGIEAEADYNMAFATFDKEGNKIVAYRNNGFTYSANHMRGGGGGETSEKIALALQMTDEEVKIYSYWYAKEGEKKADEYFASIEETLAQRHAGKIVESVGDSKALSLVLKATAGLDQWATGLEGAWNFITNDGSYIPPSATQIAASSDKLNDNLQGGWGVVGDLTQTMANQLPSILMSFVPVAGQALSLGSMGISASGNAYNEMIGLGYTKEQARSYGLLVGGSEVILGSLLDGTMKVAGKLTGATTSKLLSSVDNAFARVAIGTGSRMLGEFTEESLQTVLEPWFKSVITKTDFEAADLGEVLYSGLLGALSAGALGNIDVSSDSTVTGAIATTIKGNQVKKIDGGVSRLAKLGSTFSADTVAYKIANKVDDSTGAYTIGRLLNEANATLTEQNKSEIIKSLERKGIATEHANSIATALEAVVEGAEFSAVQRTALEANPIIARTIRDVIINPNSTVNQRTKGLYDLATNMSRSKSEVSTTDTANAIADEAKPIEASESATAEESAPQGKYEVSADGKTILKSNSEIVTPVEVESIENGNVRVKLDNGESVDASDLSFATSDEALLYEMVTRMGDVTPQTATKLIKNFKATDGVSAKTYALDIPLAYQYGKINYARGLENLDLTIDQKQTAFYHGRAAAEAEVKAKQDAITEKGSVVGAENRATIKGKGNVRFEEGAVAKTKAQKKAVKLAGLLAKAMGIDIVFYDARTKTEGENGYKSNGYFNPVTNNIHLDLQNSTDDAKTIVFTMAHEMTHFIKKWSPAKFKVFADFLMEQYGDTTVTLEAKMEETGLNEIDAYEELICDACETMLLDSNAVVKLMQLRATDLDLFEKIKLHVLELLNKIRTEYKKLGLEPTSDEAQALLKMEEVLEKVSAMFEEAAVDAVQNYQAVESLETDSVSVTEDGTIRMQMKQYEKTGRATLLRYLTEQYGNKNANDLIATIDNIYNVLSEVKQNEALSVFSNWQDTEVELDENGHPIFTTSVNNGDYELNQDFSRVCKKRRQLDFVLNMLAEDPAFEASNLTKQDFVKINKAIKKHGFEIACALCFVDSKRFRQAEWADSFANTWNDILNAVVKDGSKLTPFNFATKNPNIADDGIEIDTSKSVMYRKWSDGKEDVKSRRTYESLDQMLSKDNEGKWLEGNTNVRTIATLIRDNPELRHTFRGADIIGSQGFDTIQRLAPKIRSILDGWGGSSVPKPSSNDASYDSSIINMSKYNKETAYAMGGVRMNSFSDFMAHMFFDYCQAFADLSAKELPSQAYTKELDYVRLFGRSGQKQNMSGIAAIRDNALPTTAGKNVSKAEAEANEKIEKMIAGLDVSRLLEHLNKDIYQLTESDVEQFLDMCDYVWADESINMKHATLLQTGILYDKLSESKIEECYELLKAGEVEQALKVAGEENVDREYAKHCGTIVVGVSDAHIRKLLRDPTIRMVIPYHKSGLNPVIARELRIDAYNNYTLAQTTGVKRKGTKTSEKIGSTAIKDAYGLKDFAFYDWFGKTIDGKLYDGKATADKYLEWCEKGYYDESVGDYVYYTTKGDGYILASEFHKKATIVPKFDAFATEENYYKLLEDFDCYDTITGEHSAQGAVDFLRNGLPSDYKDVLVRALKAEQQVADDFRDHLDNKGLKDEVMEIVKARGYTPSETAERIANDTLDNIFDAVGEENIAEATELYTDVENTTRIKKQTKKNSDNTYDAIGKELLYYEEGDIAPDLTLVETVNDRTGNKEVTIKHYGQKPKNYIPKKIAYCYKLFEQHPDGSLHALFAGAKNAVPIGEWRYAQGFPRTDEGVSGMNLRERYGWHLSAGLPSAPHLMSSKYFERGYPSKGAYGHPKGSKRVWVRMAYDASTDFNSVADSTGRQNDIYGLIPFGGYYAFKENNQSEWVISSAVKIDKILTEEERQQILKDAGYDEHEAWRLKYQPTPEERSARELANKERSKAKARAKKLGIDSELSESTKAMRDAIKSRIIDNPELTNSIKKQVKKTSEYAPTFYSQMGREIDAIKMDKIGASSLVNYLKGKGIKHDEIKWSGIEAFLEGKKSVTKAELQEFVAGSQLEIVETLGEGSASITLERSRYGGDSWNVLRGGEILDTYSWSEDSELYESDTTGGGFSTKDRILDYFKEKYGSGDTRWGQYKLEGGENYRELVFKMPDSSYSNQMMRVHWGEDAEGVLVHARIQDMTTSDGKKMLFIEEIQSDWHNAGAKYGYRQQDEKTERVLRKESEVAYKKFYETVEQMVYDNSDWETDDSPYYAHPVVVAEMFDGNEAHFDRFKFTNEQREVIRKMVAEEADRQEAIKTAPKDNSAPDAPFRDNYHEYVLKSLLRMAAEEGYDSIGWTPAYIQSFRWSEDYEEGYRIEYDQDIPKFLRKYGKKWGATVGKAQIEVAEHIENGERYDAENVEVWSMDITESMKDSVLYEGQAKFQKKRPSNRTILANTLENAIDTSTQAGQNELRWLKEYQSKIDLIEKEEAHLAEVKAEIAEISFNKGTDRSKLAGLNADKTRTANRISTYDKQLIRLEAMKPIKDVLDREKEMVRKRTEQKGKERLSAYKEKVAETQRELLTRYQESRKNAIEGRHKTEMRHKIKGVVADLNKLLLDPTKDKHVPIGLQRPVAEALDIINMDTVGAEERVAKYNALIAKAKDPAEIDRLTKTRDRIELQGENLADKLASLKNAYAEFENSDDSLVRDAHNEAIENLISETVKTAGSTPIREMSLTQLEAVYDMYKAVLATVRNANKMFKEDRRTTVSENSESVKVEVRIVGGVNNRILKATKGFKKFGWNMLKPVYAMKMIGSKTLARLFENVRKGEDIWAVDVNEAKDFYREKAKKYNYNSWDFKKQYNFRDIVGSAFSLSLEQIMSLYAYSKRDKADKHLEKGGFIFDDAIEVTEKKLGLPFKYEVNDANPYRLNKMSIGEITSALTSEQKAFVDEMQTYLSDVMGAKGNEISLAMYDIKLYKEKNYFPLKTSRYFREFDPEKGGSPKIKNSGFSNKTIPQAGNPIVLSNFMDVWGGHVNDMSMYHAFVLPLEDFMRVYNYSSTAGGYDSVQQYIKNAYGAQANQYIERLMDDLNGGARVDPSAGIISKGISLFKKASTFASASVIVQQPSAIARATAYIDPKYFVDKPAATKHKATWEEIKKYAPVAVIKEMGYFDTGMGRSTVDFIKENEYEGFREKIGAVFTDSNYRDELLSKAPALADELAWCAIWKAVKREVASTTNLSVGSEEFLKEAGKRFTEVIVNTQVYDSVLSRSGLMRSKDTGMNMATAFMAEPTTSLNMVVDAVLQGKRGNKKFARNAVGAVASSVVLNSILVSLVYAARDDDEDETYPEKYLGSLTTELIDGFNPLTYIPFIKDIWSIAQGFDVERSDMSVASKLWESVEGLFNENKSGWEKVSDVAGSISSIFGLPLKNIIRDAKGMYNLTETIMSGTPTTKAGIIESVSDAVKNSIPLLGRFSGTKSNADLLYEAIISGDKNQIDRIKARYTDEKAIETAMRSALREYDPRIKEAAQARIDGNIAEYTRIAKEIIAEGNFNQDVVVGAINSEINAINKAANDKVESADDKNEPEKATSIYKADDINSALASGDMTLAKNIISELIEVKVANGSEESTAKSSIKSAITKYWKPLAKEAIENGNNTEQLRIRDMLFDTGLYGKSRYEVTKLMREWAKED